VDSPQPSNLSYLWNFCSLLGFCLVIQIVTGVTLAMHYNPSVLEAFNSVEHIMRDVNNGWLIRYLHSNTASAFFFIFALLFLGQRHPKGFDLEILLVYPSTSFSKRLCKWNLCINSNAYLFLGTNLRFRLLVRENALSIESKQTSRLRNNNKKTLWRLIDVYIYLYSGSIPVIGSWHV